MVICSITDDITDSYNASDIVKIAAKYIGGGGGGNKRDCLRATIEFQKTRKCWDCANHRCILFFYLTYILGWVKFLWTTFV